MKRIWIAILLPILTAGCGKGPPATDSGPSQDLGDAQSEAGPGNVSGTGTGAGGYGSGPTGTGGPQPADNQAIESNPD